MQSFVLGRFLTAELWDPPFVRDGGADKSNTEDLDSFEFATHVFLSPRGLLAVRFFRSGSQAEVTVFGDPRFEDFTVAKDSPVQQKANRNFCETRTCTLKCLANDFVSRGWWQALRQKARRLGCRWSFI